MFHYQFSLMKGNPDLLNTLQTHSYGRRFWNVYSILEVAMLDAENPGNESLPVSLIITEQVARFLFVFWEIVLCFGKLICVLGNWFVFSETAFCFGKLICVLGNWFAFWQIVLCFGPPYAVVLGWRRQILEKSSQTIGVLVAAVTVNACQHNMENERPSSRSFIMNGRGFYCNPAQFKVFKVFIYGNSMEYHFNMPQCLHMNSHWRPRW